MDYLNAGKMIHIRKAVLSDIADITTIYNEAVVNTTATFDTEIKTVANRTDWFNNRNENFPVIVAEKQGKVVGFASLNKWSDKKAYNITSEISLYVQSEYRGLGIGRQLIEIIVDIAAGTKLHSIIARITEGNEQSIHLHKINSFEVIGVMKKAGIKFGKLLDVTLMQKMLK